MTAFTVRGLYAITPDEPDSRALVAGVTAAIQGGARLLQYRNKSASAAVRRIQAAALLAVCRRFGVPLIVNDELALALAIGADGVHLGADDGDLRAARAALGADRLLGASCYDRLELARQAAAAGADYIALGSVFFSGTKPGAVRAPLALFAEVRRHTALPLVAIGGITPENAASVVRAGADALAVITAVFEAPDITAAARRISAAFEEQP